jgi:primase-polymerase (primpol)-like protein
VRENERCPSAAPQPLNERQPNQQQQQQYSTKLARLLPADLLELPRWGTFRTHWNADTTHLDKTPVAGFSSTDPATHHAYTAALDALQRKRGDVLGFALPADRSITGLDFDACLDPDTGALLPWAAPLLAPFIGQTYIERTPSGAGLRAYVRGQKAGTQCQRKRPNGGADGSAIELYDHDRLFTVTGNRYQDAPVMVAEMQEELDTLYAALFPQRARQAEARAGDQASRADVVGPLALDDQALLAKAQNPNSPAGRDFAALWAGDWAGRPSASEADFALAKALAWWTRHDSARVERLMRSSGLAREKWDKKDGPYGTHLERTIENAISALGTRMYSGAKGAFSTCQDDTSENDAPAEETRGATGQNEQNECCAAKDKTIAQLRRELAKERERVKHLEGELAWERKLRANKHLSPAHKLVGSALKEQWARAQAKGAPEEEMPIHLPTVAKKIGMSERTVSGAIVQLHNMGAIRRAEQHPIAESGPNKGKRVTRLYIQPQALLDAPDKLQPEKPRNHGGLRFCPECGSKLLKVKIHAHLTCMECGNKWETESAERILRGDEAEMTARADAMLAGGAFSTCQDDTRESGATDADCALVSVQIRGGNVFTPAAPPDAPDIAAAGDLADVADVDEWTIPPPPARPCIRCRETAWRWNGDRWECGHCAPVEMEAS